MFKETDFIAVVGFPTPKRVTLSIITLLAEEFLLQDVPMVNKKQVNISMQENKQTLLKNFIKLFLKLKKMIKNEKELLWNPN